MSKEFNGGDRVKFVYDARNVANQDTSNPNYGRIGTVVRRHGNGLGVWVLFDGDSREDGWHYDWRFESAEPERLYKAGDKVRITHEGWRGSWAFGSECTVKDYWNAETLVLIGACGTEGHVGVESVALAGTTPYYLVSSPVQKFDTPHATKEAAKEWITEYGTPGVEYKLHRTYDEGTFSVGRELKEAA